MFSLNDVFVGYLVCAAAYFVLTLIVAFGRRGAAIGKRLASAAAIQAIWGLTMALLVTILVTLPKGTATVVEALRSFAWLGFLITLPIQTQNDEVDVGLNKARRNGLFIALALCSLSIISDFFSLGQRLSYGWKVLIAIYGIVVVEQIYRNTPESSRWHLKFLAIAMVALFGFDLVMYSDALLFRNLNTNWWAARGFANALLMPLIAIAAARARHLKIGLSVSHKVAFHGATLMVAGGYLVVVSVVGYYLQIIGGSMSEATQAIIAFVGVVSLSVLFLSSNARAKFRVFIAKNFFAYRYDYREEWLRITESMSKGSSDQQLNAQTLAQRALESLNRLTETKTATIWLAAGARGFERRGGIGEAPASQDLITNDSSLVRFLTERDWVISPAEFKQNPKSYGNLVLPDWALSPRVSVIAPLRLRDRLIGFVSLSDPRATIALNWEVRDLIKTVGRQTASYLAQEEATRALVEVQQFDTFNKMSAFVVHDLKNLVAQLTLLLSNAARHRDNPEFQADMLSTVENVLGRMQGLLMQLRIGTKPAEKSLGLDLNQIVQAAINSKGDVANRIVCSFDSQQLMASGHPERLIRVIGHLIQNAAEANTKVKTIEISTLKTASKSQIRIKDYGAGMSAEFIREKLFRPFNSTKGMGMGIGTFESREYIEELGGSISVKSEVGVGTEFLVELPAIQEIQSPSIHAADTDTFNRNLVNGG